MKAIFIDASVTELKKNFLAIADYFKLRDKNFEAKFLTVDTASHVVSSIEEDAHRIISEKGYSLEHFTSFNRKRIRRKILEISPDFLLVNAMNTYNQLWNAISKELNIKVYLYPHGFQIDNLFYEKSELISKIRKIMRYTYALYNISKVIDRPFLKLFKDYSSYISDHYVPENI